MRHRIVAADMQFITGRDLPWERLAGKTVLITGVNGFIPSYITETLLFLNERFPDLKIRILGLARSHEKALKRFGKEHDGGKLELIIQDVCQPLDLPGEIHYIIHAASQASPDHYGRDPVGTLKANVVGTYALLELARSKRVEGFLYVSSGEVYGRTDTALPLKEGDYGYVDPLDVRSCYAESKRMGENMCVSWHHQFGVPAKIVRPFHTYGPGMRLDDVRVQAEFTSDVIQRRDIAMRSSGEAVRSFCYLADAIAGFFTVLFHGKNGKAYNVSNSGGTISIRDLAHLLTEIFPEFKLKVICQAAERPAGYMESCLSVTRPDTGEILNLGWEPKFSLSEGFKRTVESYL